MKTPNYRTEDWHLDNYNGMVVTVVFNDNSTLEATLLDSDSKGLFIGVGKKMKASYIPNGAYRKLDLPDLIKESPQKEEK